MGVCAFGSAYRFQISELTEFPFVLIPMTKRSCCTILLLPLEIPSSNFRPKNSPDELFPVFLLDHSRTLCNYTSTSKLLDRLR
jgi:hypothetical protein